MLHPSYTDLMKTINSEVEEGDTPVVNSRYSIAVSYTHLDVYKRQIIF